MLPVASQPGGHAMAKPVLLMTCCNRSTSGRSSCARWARSASSTSTRPRRRRPRWSNRSQVSRQLWQADRAHRRRVRRLSARSIALQLDEPQLQAVMAFREQLQQVRAYQGHAPDREPDLSGPLAAALVPAAAGEAVDAEALIWHRLPVAQGRQPVEAQPASPNAGPSSLPSSPARR